MTTRLEAGVRALHLAAGNGHSEVVRLLVESSADVEASMTRLESGRAMSGVTALHLAVDSGHLDTMDVLLDHGSSVNIATTSTTTEESTC